MSLGVLLALWLVAGIVVGMLVATPRDMLPPARVWATGLVALTVFVGRATGYLRRRV